MKQLTHSCLVSSAKLFQYIFWHIGVTVFFVIFCLCWCACSAVSLQSDMFLLSKMHFYSPTYLSDATPILSYLISQPRNLTCNNTNIENHYVVFFKLLLLLLGLQCLPQHLQSTYISWYQISSSTPTYDKQNYKPSSLYAILIFIFYIADKGRKKMNSLNLICS
jgi:hypothetical protein